MIMGMGILVVAILTACIFSLVLVGLNQSVYAGVTPDTTPPILTIPPDSTYEATALNTPTADVNLERDGAASASDPESGINSLTNNAPATYPLGDTIVTWTATNGALLQTTGDQTVTIQDTTPPVVTAPTPITVEGNVLGGVAFDDSAVTTFLAGASATDDVDGPTAVTDDSLTSGVYGVGVTTITFSSTDTAGNTGTATSTITVTDFTPPVITVPADTSIEADASPTSGASKDPAVTGVATATDIVDPIPTIIFSDSSVFPTPDPATKIVEVITRTWTATDATGNSSSGDQIITVFDTTAPTITVSDFIFRACAIPVPEGLITFGETTSDLVDPDPSLIDDRPAEFPIGDTTVTWTSEDASGNVAVVPQKITIDANDPDGDGITECVDTQTAVLSDDFDDTPPLGQTGESGQTEGEIITRGDQVDLLIFDVIDPDGILAFAPDTGGAAPAKITVCNKIGEINLDAGESAIATCTSVKIEILTGQVLIQFNTGGIPGTSTLAPTNILVYDKSAQTITNLSATKAVIQFGSQFLTIQPGQTVDITPFAFPSSKSSGPHEPPTIGKNLAGTKQMVNNGLCINADCFTVTKKFHEEFKLYEMMSGTHTISITTFCAQGVEKCNYVAIGIMPYTDDMNNAKWKIELQKDHLGNLTPVITDPEGYLGEVTVTANIIGGKFWIVSFTIEFKNIGTDPMKVGVQVRDNKKGTRNFYFNEGIKFIDAHAYPSIETKFEAPLKVEPLCIGEDVFHRHNCAFDKVKDWATNNAEETLRQMQNNEYIYK